MRFWRGAGLGSLLAAPTSARIGAQSSRRTRFWRTTGACAHLQPPPRAIHRGRGPQGAAVKISDSGRIRNELQTLASQALEFTNHKIRVRFDRIDKEVMLPEKQRVIREVLEWYKKNHPVWFSWLEIA
jgi:hypothetical protein